MNQVLPNLNQADQCGCHGPEHVPQEPPTQGGDGHTSGCSCGHTQVMCRSVEEDTHTCTRPQGPPPHPHTTFCPLQQLSSSHPLPSLRPPSPPPPDPHTQSGATIHFSKTTDAPGGSIPFSPHLHALPPVLPQACKQWRLAGHHRLGSLKKSCRARGCGVITSLAAHFTDTPPTQPPRVVAPHTATDAPGGSISLSRLPAFPA